MSPSVRRLFTRDEIETLPAIAESMPDTKKKVEFISDFRHMFYSCKDIRHVVNSIFPKKVTKISRKFLLLPLDDMPLFINDREFYIRMLAYWRLRLGK